MLNKNTQHQLAGDIFFCSFVENNPIIMFYELAGSPWDKEVCFCIFCWNLDSQALHIWCWSLPPSPLFLSAAATEQRRRRPGLQKLENSFNPGQVTGYRYKPSHPSLLRRTLGKLFTPRAGPQGTIQMSRCLAMVFFSLRMNPLPAH